MLLLGDRFTPHDTEPGFRKSHAADAQRQNQSTAAQLAVARARLRNQLDSCFVTAPPRSAKLPVTSSRWRHEESKDPREAKAEHD
jgi:hypothetical protein